MLIKELPKEERPREKALRYGIDQLTNEELLALLIGSGGKNNSALDIAKNLLEDAKGLYYLVNKSVEELQEYKGISVAKSLNLGAIFTLAKRYREKEFMLAQETVNADFLYNKYADKLLLEEKEHFILIVLNKRKEIVHEITLFIGSSNRLSISYREIFKQIINHRGYYFYIIHNHPNNDLTPSKRDISFTNELTHKCDKLDIVLMDHLIFSERGYYSFLEEKEHRI